MNESRDNAQAQAQDRLHIHLFDPTLTQGHSNYLSSPSPSMTYWTLIAALTLYQSQLLQQQRQIRSLRQQHQQQLNQIEQEQLHIAHLQRQIEHMQQQQPQQEQPQELHAQNFDPLLFPESWLFQEPVMQTGEDPWRSWDPEARPIADPSVPSEPLQGSPTNTLSPLTPFDHSLEERHTPQDSLTNNQAMTPIHGEHDDEEREGGTIKGKRTQKKIPLELKLEIIS
ncbi:hypothetical protein BGX34_005622, partial [Mortierella sp. NVP85]